MECGFDTYKNALIKNLVILFDFFCAVEPIYFFFQTDFFYLISCGPAPLGLRGTWGNCPQCPCYYSSDCFIYTNEMNQFHIFFNFNRNIEFTLVRKGSLCLLGPNNNNNNNQHLDMPVFSPQLKNRI